MTQQGVRPTADQVPATASDDVSRPTGSELAGPWSGAGQENEASREGSSGSRTSREKKEDALADPEAARRRAERRAGRITAGVVELEQRLADLVRSGLAAAEREGYGLWEETAARMVDAQAPGLAARVRELGAIPASGPGWPARLLEECALLHLLNQAWLHRDGLPEDLASAVRTHIGLPTTPTGPPLLDDWLVLARYDTSDGRLTTRRIWLHGATSARTALVLSYGPAGRAPELALPVGRSVRARVTPYPVGPRVALGDLLTDPAPTSVRPPGISPAEATARYGTALRTDPWLNSVPVTLDDVVPTPAGDTWQLVDTESKTALPLTPAALSRPGLWRLIALSGGGPVKVFGECGHRGFTPLTAWASGTSEPIGVFETMHE
ncbi:SWIM zinc finger family protein [Streptomyces roseirectus]|uniref:SWIM zinc finger family protein n=1 Tax=Streptomyces roseirectus TaxID=2768066 RepID=A0A7H0ID13_9ACTN|nr:SWIM zinc finger family protein [Streptomyces roseirectus]QNP70679.1 SWIM zinc finger family protein [Streptomyces roseirectus]